MTDNIQKLYEIAGVDYEERYNNCTLNKEGECRFKGSCDICKYVEERYIYPTFTAEKQLELIKWLCLNAYRNYIHFRFKQDTNTWTMECSIWGTLEYESFENALASMVLALWQDLTEKEKEQIKEILE